MTEDDTFLIVGIVGTSILHFHTPKHDPEQNEL